MKILCDILLVEYIKYVQQKNIKRSQFIKYEVISYVSLLALYYTELDRRRLYLGNYVYPGNPARPVLS